MTAFVTRVLGGGKSDWRERETVNFSLVVAAKAVDFHLQQSRACTNDKAGQVTKTWPADMSR